MIAVFLPVLLCIFPVAIVANPTTLATKVYTVGLNVALESQDAKTDEVKDDEARTKE